MLKITHDLKCLELIRCVVCVAEAGALCWSITAGDGEKGKNNCYLNLLLSINIWNHRSPSKLMCHGSGWACVLHSNAVMRHWIHKGLFIDKAPYQHISTQMLRFWRCLQTDPNKCWLLASIGQLVCNCSALVYVWRLQAGLRLSWVLWVTFNLNLKCLQLC